MEELCFSICCPIGALVVKSGYADLFSEVIIDTYNREHKARERHSELVKEIDQLNDKVRKARELLLAGDIEGSDYRFIKTESETGIERLEVRLSEALRSKRAYVDIDLSLAALFSVLQT